MFGSRATGRKSLSNNAESPFWISFADLMTALMVLFLVVMVAAVASMSREKATVEDQRRLDKEKILEIIREITKDMPEVVVDADNGLVNFGSRANFAFGKYELSDEQESTIRKVIPTILRAANSDAGKRLLKRVVIEGYTDRTGTYLSNLNLSLLRSQRVLCALFSTTGENALSAEQMKQVRDIFLVGGYSFNSTKPTADESRRVELRLEFWGIGEKKTDVVPNIDQEFGRCAI